MNETTKRHLRKMLAAQIRWCAAEIAREDIEPHQVTSLTQEIGEHQAALADMCAPVPAVQPTKEEIQTKAIAEAVFRAVPSLDQIEKDLIKAQSPHARALSSLLKVARGAPAAPPVTAVPSQAGGNAAA